MGVAALKNKFKNSHILQNKSILLMPLPPLVSRSLDREMLWEFEARDLLPVWISFAMQCSKFSLNNRKLFYKTVLFYLRNNLSFYPTPINISCCVLTSISYLLNIRYIYNEREAAS